MLSLNNIKISQDELPVDCSFESRTKDLLRKSYPLMAAPSDEQLQGEFSRTLYECRMELEHVVDAYGPRYRGGKGAYYVLQIAGEVIPKLLEIPASVHLPNIRRYYEKILELQLKTYGTQSTFAVDEWTFFSASPGPT